MKNMNFKKTDWCMISLLTVVFSCLILNGYSMAEECLFAVQLKDPVTRGEYEAIIDAGRTNNLTYNSAIDPLAVQCLACHDGVLAKEARYRVSDGSLYKIKSIETIKGAHPVGMDYEKTSWREGYASVETLPVDMVLMNGTVGCVTCHNLLGNNSYYHVVENSSSGLCFSCHKK